jgi:hypothetical protein
MSIDTDDGGGYLEEMSDEDIARFRSQAKECQLQAERSVRVTDKDAWLRMAGEWIRLAEDAERHRDRRP